MLLMDYYGVLGVGPHATHEEIRESYRRKALQYHPDRHPMAQAQAAHIQFQYVSDAYTTLSDPKQRRQYDLQRSQPHTRLYNPLHPTRRTTTANTTANTTAAATAAATTAEEQDSKQFEQSYKPTSNPDAVFANVFDDLLRSELHSSASSSASASDGNYFWQPIGSISGLALGFIMANIPGALMGWAAGRYVGAIRDAHGRAVLDVFMDLPRDQRVQILVAIAKKVLEGTVLGAPSGM